MLGHSGARVCFVENVDQLAKVLLWRSELPDLERVIVMDEVSGLDDGFITSLSDVGASGGSGVGSSIPQLDEPVKEVTASDLATPV